MLTGGLLALSGADREWFNKARARDALPFPGGRGGKGVSQVFTMREAWQLRLVHVLTMDAGSGRGILISEATRIVTNAGCKAAEIYGPQPRDLVGHDHAIWLGGVEFTGSDRRGDAETWAAWFAGPVAGLSSFIADQLADPTAEALRGAHAVRIFGLVNATAAALHVLQAADDLGIGE